MSALLHLQLLANCLRYFSLGRRITIRSALVMSDAFGRFLRAAASREEYQSKKNNRVWIKRLTYYPSKQPPLSEYVKLITGVIHLMTECNGGVASAVQCQVRAWHIGWHVTRSSARAIYSFIDDRIDVDDASSFAMRARTKCSYSLYFKRHRRKI